MHRTAAADKNVMPACPVCPAQPEKCTNALPNGPVFQDRRYWQCAACKTIFLHPLPEREENLAFEGEDNAQALAAADDARLSQLEKRLAPAGKPTMDQNQLLEIGCGAGRLLGLAQQAGWQCTGIEMSASLADIARSQAPSAHIINQDFMAIDPSSLPAFDAIIALDVIEHVLDVSGFLARCNRMLKPGGRLVLHTPNAQSLRARLHGGKWNMLLPEYHFTLLSPQALQGQLEDAGFHRIRITTTSGTGQETGISKIVSRIKEAALASLEMGNSLLVTAERA